MTEKRDCPDCEVEMEQARVTAGGYNMNIKSEREEGSILQNALLAERCYADSSRMLLNAAEN